MAGLQERKAEDVDDELPTDIDDEYNPINIESTPPNHPEKVTAVANWRTLSLQELVCLAALRLRHGQLATFNGWRTLSALINLSQLQYPERTVGDFGDCHSSIGALTTWYMFSLEELLCLAVARLLSTSWPDTLFCCLALKQSTPAPRTSFATARPFLIGVCSLLWSLSALHLSEFLRMKLLQPLRLF